MGSSFTEYRGAGFWSRDAGIELWLYLLAEEVRRQNDPPVWLRAAAEHWCSQATAGMNGCVSAELDHHASTAERAAVLQDLAEQALAQLRSRGDTLSADWLNSLGLGPPGAVFTQDAPAEAFTRVGEAFVGLLRGEIEWDAATSPVL
jgi:hypothetical protein